MITGAGSTARFAGSPTRYGRRVQQLPTTLRTDSAPPGERRPVVSGASGNLKRGFGNSMTMFWGWRDVIVPASVLAQAVPEAGPGVIVSFIIAGIAAGLRPFATAELASAVPISGSVYAYTTSARRMRWWCGLPTVGIRAATAAVVVGWSGYVNKSLNLSGLQMPHVLPAAPTTIPVANPPVILIGPRAAVDSRGQRVYEGQRDHGADCSAQGMFIIAFSAAPTTSSDFVPFGVAGIGSAAGTIFIGLGRGVDRRRRGEGPAEDIRVRWIARWWSSPVKRHENELRLMCLVVGMAYHNTQSD